MRWLNIFDFLLLVHLIPSNRNTMFAFIQIIPSWRNWSHVRRIIIKFSIFIHGSLELLNQTTLDNLTVCELSIHIIACTLSHLSHFTHSTKSEQMSVLL